jgi:thioredoxin reductase
MTSTYDAVVVGGGHNALVAAAYLGRQGARTVVAAIADRRTASRGAGRRVGRAPRRSLARR